MTKQDAEVAEQADALRSGRSGLYAHVGSIPTFGTSGPGFGRSTEASFYCPSPVISCTHSSRHKEKHNP